MTTEDSQNITLAQGRSVKRYGAALERRNVANRRLETYATQVHKAAEHASEWSTVRSNVVPGPLPKADDIVDAQHELDESTKEIKVAIEDMSEAGLSPEIWKDRETKPR